MDLIGSKLRRPCFTIAETAAAIALIAVAIRRPVFGLPVGSVILTMICDRAGLSLAWTLCMTVVIGLAVGIGLDVFAAHR